MQSDQHRVLPGRGAHEQQDEAHRAPNAEEDEDDGNEGQLHVSHRSEGVRLRSAGQDGTVLGQSRMLHRTDNTERECNKIQKTAS